MQTLIQAVVTFIAASAVHAQQAVQWRVEDGGNGHWYLVRRNSSPICWDAASVLATAMGGHLATITSSQEQERITSLTAAQQGPATELDPWIGATCSGRAWGDWYWVTGEPFAYHGWLPTAPNPGWNEEYVHLWRWLDARWNDGYRCGTDAPTTVHGYVIEWSADCNSDGIVDYGQILDGSLSDVNADGIPDVCQAPCVPSDLNNDGAVDGSDLGALLSDWGPAAGQGTHADTNGDGIVNGADLGFLLANWGPCPN